MIYAALAALVVSIAMLLVRFYLGKTVFDRILAANVIGTNIILLILFLGNFKGTDLYIDIAIVYALLNFIATIGYLRFFHYGFRK